jgi:hypothetical protein
MSLTAAIFRHVTKATFSRSHSAMNNSHWDLPLWRFSWRPLWRKPKFSLFDAGDVCAIAVIAREF